MKLLEKLIREKNQIITDKPITTVLKEEGAALGLKSGDVLYRIIKKNAIPNHKTVVAMERRYGYSFEELNAEAK